MLKVSNFYRKRQGSLFVENNLSKKPAKAVEKIESVIKKQSSYNMSLKQDYSKNVVEMKLLGMSYGAKEGYYVYQARKLPVTSSVKTYTKTAQEMIDVQNEYNVLCNQRFTKSKRTFFQRVKDFLFDSLDV